MYLHKNKELFGCVAIALVLLMVSCSKTTKENISTVSYSDYYPITVGQSLLYRLDSTVLLSFGADTVTRTYLQKDSVMSVNTDLTGAITYHVNSYIKSYTGNDDWVYLTAYYVSPKSNTLELVGADNLRFIKLASPVSDAYTWNGNGYFIQDNNNISTDSSLAKYLNWSYVYSSINQAQSLSTASFDSTITVSEIDKETGTLNYSSYYQKYLAQEIYAKGWGLIHRKLLFLTYQPNSGFESDSYGVELTRIQ